jgi:hypothetical protein
MKKEAQKVTVKTVNHSNQHTAQKTAVVLKDKQKWPYDLMDHKIPRPKH